MTGALRLAWATPWNAASAVALVNRESIAALLAAGHAVEVLRTEAGEALDRPPLAASAASTPYRTVAGMNRDELGFHYDAVVVSFGNDPKLFAGAMQLVGAVPFVTIMHDASLERLAAGAPEWIAAHACAAVAPDDCSASRLRRSCPGPVIALPPVVPDPDLASPARTAGRLVVVSTCDATSASRAGAVIEAVGVSPVLRRCCAYRLVGDVADADRRRLERVAAEAGLRIPPRFTGRVAMDELWQHLGDADAVCCLDDPAPGNGEMSLVIALLSARPALVLDGDAHADLPGGLVLRCAPGDPALDVAHHLEWIAGHPAAARAMGGAARTHARRKHGAARYAAELVALVRAAVPASPVIAARLSLRRTLAGLGAAPDDPATACLEHTLGEMLGLHRD